MQLRSSFILIIHLLHSGGVGGGEGDGIPEQERSCFKSLYISKISLPVHNFSIMMLLTKIRMMTLVYKGFLNPLIQLLISFEFSLFSYF